MAQLSASSLVTGFQHHIGADQWLKKFDAHSSLLWLPKLKEVCKVLGYMFHVHATFTATILRVQWDFINLNCGITL